MIMNLNKIKKSVKKFLAVPYIRRTINRFQLFKYRLLSLGKLFAVPYHLIFSRVFDREIFAYTTAMYEYQQRILDARKSNVLIRRNIHRLEKGLIMENRRDVFALDYIEETVENYGMVLEKAGQSGLEPGELQWAYDVLYEYFDSVDATYPLISKMKAKFESLPKPAQAAKDGRYAPYESRDLSGIRIPTYEEFMDLSRKRRSVRWYKDVKVPREEIDKALLAASLAPSACNRQPFEYRIFDDPALVKEIANLPFGTSGYADNLPIVAVLIGDLSNYFSSRDRHTIYVDAALSAMAFMYALETLRLSSVAINWPDFSLLEKKMKRKLNLNPYERPIILIGIGYAKEKGKIPFSQKKPLELLRSYNNLGNKDRE